MRFISAIGLALALSPAVAQSKVVRDWAKDPAVVQIDTTSDVFAIGDVHGDYDRLVKLLAAARIVDAHPGSVHWSAGSAILLFTGDLIDKGPKAPAVIALLCALRVEAAKAGGRVVALSGNHEVDFLRNPLSEKVKQFALQLRDAGLDPQAVAACAGDAGAFLCGMPFAARINDWFFSHAGNTAGRSLAQLIADLQNGIDREGYETAQLTAADSLLQARLGGTGPSWLDAAGKQRTPLQTVAAYADSLGVAHIVQGHQHNAMRFADRKTRKLGEIYQWRGKLFLIDIGMSCEIDESEGAALLLRRGTAGVVCPDGRITALWDAAKPNASKAVRCGK